MRLDAREALRHLRDQVDQRERCELGDLRVVHLRKEQVRVAVDGVVPLELALDAGVGLRHAAEQLQRLLDQVLVVRGRQEREHQGHALVRAEQVLERLKVVGELGHRHHHHALQPLARDGQLRLLLQHGVHLRRDAVLEEGLLVVGRVLRRRRHAEAGVLLIVGIRRLEQREQVAEAHFAVRVGARGVLVERRRPSASITHGRVRATMVAYGAFCPLGRR